MKNDSNADFTTKFFSFIPHKSSKTGWLFSIEGDPAGQRDGGGSRRPSGSLRLLSWSWTLFISGTRYSPTDRGMPSIFGYVKDKDRFMLRLPVAIWIAERFENCVK